MAHQQGHGGAIRRVGKTPDQGTEEGQATGYDNPASKSLEINSGSRGWQPTDQVFGPSQTIRTLQLKAGSRIGQKLFHF